MKAISLKVQGDSLTIAKGAVSGAINFIVANSLKIAGVASAICYFGCMFDSQMMIYAGAVAAMGALRAEYSKKGGKR